MKRKNGCKAMILTMFIRTKLREFLDRTGDYGRFTKNLWWCGGVLRYLLYEVSLIDDRIPELIDYAFQWSDTPEGYNHWAKLHQDWRKFASKMLASESLRNYFGISARKE